MNIPIESNSATIFGVIQLKEKLEELFNSKNNVKLWLYLLYKLIKPSKYISNCCGGSLRLLNHKEFMNTIGKSSASSL